MGCSTRSGVGLCLISTVLLHHDIPIGFDRQGVLVCEAGV